MRKKILFYCPSQEGLASELAMENALNKDLKLDLSLGYIFWSAFDDGFPNLKVDDVDKLNDADVVFLADFSKSEEIFRQLAVIYALPSYGINSLKVVLPFFSTGTMDRVMEDGQIVTAKTLARTLSVIPPAACPAQIFIFDIHALQEQFYFSDSIRVNCLSAIDCLLAELKNETAPLAIAFPDEGSYKRFGHYLKGYDQIICEKRRLNKGRQITIKDGNAFGKKVIIVDDLILSGNTLLECAKCLKADGASEVAAYATHAIFPKKDWLRFSEEKVGLYLTNSCPEVSCQIFKEKESLHEVKVLSLMPIVMEKIINR